MRILLAMLFLLAALYSKSQTETKIDPDNFDVLYLEELVRVKINDLRTKKKIPKLQEDSILYLSAQNHAEFMSKKRQLSHYQSANKTMKTPQNRADFFGAKRYLVGENILYTCFNSNVTGSKGANFSTYTYEILAEAIIHSWVNSRPHYENLLDRSYKYSGLALSVNYETKQVFVCQDFAKTW